MNVIKEKKFAPARNIIESRWKQLKDARIKLQNGQGASNGMPYNKSVCIMEATAYILGYDKITDHPPCTSATIRDFMIEINDSVSDRKRAQLKKVVPDIVNTAPTKWVKYGGHALDNGDQLMTIENNPRYRQAEQKREKMFIDLARKNKWDVSDFHYSYNDDPYDGLEASDMWHMMIEKSSMPKLLDFIRELAAVAKFDAENEAADIVPNTVINPEATNG